MNETSAAVKQFINSLLLVVFWLLIFLNLPLLCHSDGHNHDHHHRHDEHPSFKYSKAANEPYSGSSHEHSGHDVKSHFTDDNEVAKNSWWLWIEALASTLLISIAPFIILFFVPLDKSKEKEPLLKILLSFASGGLLGDAFLHLIPHALAPHATKSSQHSHSHSHSHTHSEHHEEEHGHDMSVGLFVLLGIVTFLLVEKSVRLIKGGHTHSHSHVDKKKENEVQQNDKGDSGKKKSGDVKKVDGKKDIKKKREEKPTEEKISVSGYLNLAADFTHNLTDGLAIGASYLAGRNVGIITTITILLHEVPHEIGDFAILVQSGCSKRKAMGLQLITALGALTGTFLSLIAEGAGDIATSWILPFTAGGFIYISTVSIIPELLEDTKFLQSVKEIFAMLVGVFLMVLIADYE